MRKVLLFSILLVTMLAVSAYETIIIHFPDGELWEPAYYQKRGNETILQYVPGGQTSNNWKRTIVVHAYNNVETPIDFFAQNEIKKMRGINPKGNYNTIRFKENDSIFTRCTETYNNIPGHCEFLRITRGHHGIITIQYMNRNKKDFDNNYTLWLETVRRAKLMDSYWRTERTFDKSMYFEL